MTSEANPPTSDIKGTYLAIARLLVKENRLMTVEKVSSETGLDKVLASQSLEIMASRGLIERKSVDDFDEDCYRATDKTKSFYDMAVSMEEETAASEVLAPPSSPEEGKADPTTDVDPVLSFLQRQGASDSLIAHYREQRDKSYRYKREAQAWKRNIQEMVRNVTRDLK